MEGLKLCASKVNSEIQVHRIQQKRRDIVSWWGAEAQISNRQECARASSRCSRPTGVIGSSDREADVLILVHVVSRQELRPMNPHSPPHSPAPDSGEAAKGYKGNREQILGDLVGFTVVPRALMRFAKG